MKLYKLSLIFIVYCFLTAPHSFAQKTKPNVIIIMTDDMGNNLGNLGNPWLNTPNIDKLSEESVLLTNFHQDLLCTPSRASLMTGKYSLRTGAWRTSIGRSNMRLEEITVAEVFQKNGYRTGSFGKWHLGDVWPFRSIDQGFEEAVNLNCGGIGQISDYWGNDYFDDVYYHNGKPQQYKGYCTDVFFNETIRFIKECTVAQEPFLIYLAPNVAHLPRIVEEKYSKPFLENGHDKNQAIFYGMIQNLDENFGQLTKTLKELDLEDDTIIIFTTDDGTAAYAAQFDKDGWALNSGFNMGQRGGKGSSYEGGHRLFFYIKWIGGKLEGGQKIDELTSVMDVFPTLIDLCDIQSESKIDFDGNSIKNLLYGEVAKERTLVFSKLTPNKPDNFKRNKFCVAQGDWRWVDRKELYNVKKDREQRNNLTDKYPDIVQHLESKLNVFLQKNAQDRETAVRFILGDEQKKSITLTTQDLWVKSAFNQSHVKKLSNGSGSWKVDFVQTGTYKFTLSRFPLYTNLPFNEKLNGKRSKSFTPTHAKISINNKEYEAFIGATDTNVFFELEIEKGAADIETWIFSKEGIIIPSYFLEVELINGINNT